MKDQIKVTNYGEGSVGYYSEALRVRRKWDSSGSYKLISEAELQDVVSTQGGRTLFMESLLVEDEEMRKKYELEGSEKYLMSEENILKALNGTVFQLENLLKITPTSVKLRFVKVAIANKFPDFNKLNLLKKYTGVDLARNIAEQLNEENNT